MVYFVEVAIKKNQQAKYLLLNLQVFLISGWIEMPTILFNNIMWAQSLFSLVILLEIAIHDGNMEKSRFSAIMNCVLVQKIAQPLCWVLLGVLKLFLRVTLFY